MPQESTPDALCAAQPMEDYLDRAGLALSAHGFVRDRTFAAVSLCRDELTHPMLAGIAARWDLPFNLGGLGALPSLGRTGWGACLSHVPGGDGRGHLVVFGFPHIGLNPDGSPGSSIRRAQEEPTPTCGALVALLESMGADPIAEPGTLRSGPAGHLADAEADRLRALVGAELTGEAVDLVDLTLATERAVNKEIWLELEELAPWDSMDVAVLTGVQVHTHGGRDRIMGIDARLRVGPGAEEHVLDLGSPADPNQGSG